MPVGRILLYPFSLLFGLGVTARNRLYDSGLFHSKLAPCTVISIGNISVGGTGKTPMTLYLLSMLKSAGFHPASLSRGYGRETRGYLELDANADARRYGDEACMVRAAFPELPVAVGEDRHNAAVNLHQRHKVDVIVLDDAFQHRSIARDLDIVLVDATRPPGRDELLPAGRLRESPRSLERADRVVLTRIRDVSEAENLARALNLKKWSACYMQTQAFVPFSGGKEILPAEMNEVILFSGIGNAAAFEADIRALGIPVRHHAVFPDHHPYTRAELQSILGTFDAAAQRAGRLIITTEKDFFRLRGGSEFEWLKSQPLVYAKSALVWIHDEAGLKSDVLKVVQHYGSKIR